MRKRHGSESRNQEVLLQELKEGTEAVAKYCAQLLDAYKLDGIQVVEVMAALPIADYFVVASARNERQLKAASDELFRKLREAGVSRARVEGYREGRWILVDFRDVVVHLFLEEARAFYDLDSLWGDCPRIAWSVPGGRAIPAVPGPSSRSSTSMGT